MFKSKTPRWAMLTDLKTLLLPSYSYSYFFNGLQSWGCHGQSGLSELCWETRYLQCKTYQVSLFEKLKRGGYFG